MKNGDVKYKQIYVIDDKAIIDNLNINIWNQSSKYKNHLFKQY